MGLDLIKLSNSLHGDADNLLRKTKLIEKLSKFGKVVISGSYYLDLMMDGDIDLFIVNKNIDKKKSIDILKHLIMEEDFKGYLYYDWTKKYHVGFPRGYYIGLKTEFKKRKWKIDVWLINEAFKPTEKLINLVKSRITVNNKYLILKLKYEAKTKGLNVRGSDIYKKVLKK
ncbi:MAG: hypothetical protein ACOYL8_01170 [Patescibacteria group bacterium]